MTYKITINGQGEQKYDTREIPQAKKIDIVPWLHTFVFKESGGLWNVTEATTGLNISYGNTRKGAATEALTALERANKESLLAHMERQKAYYATHGIKLGDS